MNISDKIRQIRVSLNKSQGEMATLLGLTQQVYSNLELGKTKRIDTKVLEFVQNNFVENNKSNNQQQLNSIDIKTHSETATSNNLVAELVASNRILANAVADFAITEKNLSENTLRLTKIVESNSHAHQETDLIAASIESKVLELLSVLHSGKGKQFRTREAALATMNKLLSEIENRNEETYIECAKDI